MKTVMFVCSGNVCRSPMAEFIFRELIRQKSMEAVFAADSAGTNVYAPNSPVHNGTCRELRRRGIPYSQRGSKALLREDYGRCELIIGMERRHVNDMLALFGGDPDRKCCRLLDFTEHPRDIDDPWYTGDFITACRDITEGCEALLDHLFGKGKKK